MAFRKIRNMKVYKQSRYRYKSTPTIMLKGQWHNELGFGYGTPICVECSGVEMLDINAIKPFRHHLFHLYEGDRLNDMVEIIREYGVLNPVIVQKMHYGYEVLSGHNRQNAAKLAGLEADTGFCERESAG